jgi:hypothetical protein
VQMDGGKVEFDGNQEGEVVGVHNLDDDNDEVAACVHTLEDTCNGHVECDVPRVLLIQEEEDLVVDNIRLQLDVVGNDDVEGASDGDTGVDDRMSPDDMDHFPMPEEVEVCELDLP